MRKEYMDIQKYLSAAQVADLAKLSKSLEELRNTKVIPTLLDFSSHTLDPTLFAHVW